MEGSAPEVSEVPVADSCVVGCFCDDEEAENPLFILHCGHKGHFCCLATWGGGALIHLALPAEIPFLILMLSCFVE